MSYDYANARVGGMRARLIGKAGILALVSQPSLAARVDVLKTSDYGPTIVTELGRGPLSLAGIERGLRARLTGDCNRIRRYLQGARAGDLLDAFLSFEDGWSIKTILRGITHGEPGGQILSLLAPGPRLDEVALAELANQRGVKGVVDLLASWRSPYAVPLQKAMPDFARQRDLQALERNLDRHLFSEALAIAQKDGENGRILHTIVTTQIDLINAATLLKAGGGPVPDTLLLPGGSLTWTSRSPSAADLAITQTVEVVAVGHDHPEHRALLRRLEQFLAPDHQKAAGTEPPASRDPFAIDLAIRAALREVVRQLARTAPLSLAVPIAFILDRQEEVRRIRLALRAAEFGLEPEAFIALLEA
jgi:V/A-type H+-transporting ATPase subunit C